ncbi:MAG TPA: SDR family NAD(P)-dependent oxidoreductase, partial [Thiolinea sp.]|nr:SDR family NAD(P)-dependent oxidoreductase [Thiolinea sp.]
MTHKIALITGGSRGLGKNTALHLARKGVDSIITYRSQQAEADQVVQEIQKLGGKAVALQLDTGHLKSFAEFASQLDNALNTTWSSNHFDYLVNNAGMGIYNSLAETTEEQFDELMNVHFKGVFFLTQKLLPLMRDGGRIINLSSGLARFSFPGYGAYASMKGAIEVY